MKKLPDAELELMMVIWNSEKRISRTEIEEQLDSSKNVAASTILKLLSRLEERGFVKREKEGKINYYSALVDKDKYLKETSRNILEKMFGGSLSNFAAALYMDEELSSDDIEELQQFIDSKAKK
jgi:predicted transcriptional regulator